MQILYNKGYYVYVVSWENDADDYRYEWFPCKSLEEAVVLAKFCKLFSSVNSFPQGIGNINSEYELSHAHAVVDKFVAENPQLTEFFGISCFDDAVDLLSDIGLAGSEHFYTRVAERVEIRRFDSDVMYDIVSY